MQQYCCFPDNPQTVKLHDQALVTARSVNSKKLKTDRPLAEKDEEKEAEESMRKRSKKAKSQSMTEIVPEQKTAYNNRPHMLFRPLF